MKKEKTTNVINIGQLMRQYAYTQPKKRSPKDYFNVSKEAVKETISYIDAQLDSRMNLAVENAIRNKRRTIMSEDIIFAFGIVHPTTREEPQGEILAKEEMEQLKNTITGVEK